MRVRSAAVLVAAAFILATLALAAAPVQVATAVTPCGTNGVLSGPTNDVYTCTYLSTTPDTFTVPSTVSHVDVVVVAGRGGHGWAHISSSNQSKGGYGASVTATVDVTGGSTLTVTVAGNGADAVESAGASPGSVGGTHGGGAGGGGACCPGGGGGGASSVYAGSTPLIVAGGGGGAGGGAQGHGGFATSIGTPGQPGGPFYSCQGGAPGTLVGPGAGGGQSGQGCTGTSGTDGSGGSGGAGGNSAGYTAGGGGGAGYFGGGGGQGNEQGEGSGGGSGSTYSIANSAFITTDTTGVPKITISWVLPAPEVSVVVKDDATLLTWDGSQNAGAKAYGTSTVTNINGIVPTGTAIYGWTPGINCYASPTSTETKTLSNGNVPNSSATSALGAGSYSLRVSYSGDANYAPSFGCSSFTVAEAGQGTMIANTGVVSAGVKAQTIVFTYTLGASMSNGELQLTVPPGWSPPYSGPTSPGYTRTDKGSISSPTGTERTLRITGITGPAGSTVTITYGFRTATNPGATAPTTPGSQIWSVAQKASLGGTALPLASSPVIDVKAKDGSGTMTASLSTVRRNATGNTITFTYTVAAGGIAGGAIDIKIPKGWSAASQTPSAPGYVTTSAGTLSASFSRIYVGNLTLPAGSKVTIVYGSRAGGGPGARATPLVTTQTWKVRQESTPFPFSRFKAIAASPKIRVT